MDLQLTHLRTLEAVARSGSFSRAAEAMHLTQPAVSMQIRQLEATVGLPLLERVGKRAFPTSAGEVLLAHAGRALRELESGVEALQRLRGIVAGRIRLGTGATASGYLLPPLFRRFRAAYPDSELIVVVGNTPEITRAVVNNDLDLGVVSLPVRGRELVTVPFFRDELVAIAPPQREWRGRERIAAAELAREPLILYEHGGMIRHIIDDWFRREGAVPRVPMELGNIETIKQLVRAALGLSVTSWISVRAEVRMRKLAAIRLEPPLFRSMGIIRRKDKARTPVLEAFLAALDDLRPSLEASGARRHPAGQPSRRAATRPAATR